jgi:hypothetical protein
MGYILTQQSSNIHYLIVGVIVTSENYLKTIQLFVELIF